MENGSKWRKEKEPLSSYSSYCTVMKELAESWKGTEANVHTKRYMLCIAQ